MKMITNSLFNPETGNFRIATVKQIRGIYFENMSQQTFNALFSEENKAALVRLGFRSFRGYQNPKVVQYMIETVGRIEGKKLQ